MAVLAPLPVIEPVAVANVEALLAAIPPDRELDEPRENGREGRIERTGVDLLGSTGNDFGAAACPVAAGAVRVGSLEAPQDPGPVQEIVDQGIDRNQVHADFQPPRANVSGADQNAGQAPWPAPCRKRRRHCAMVQSGPSATCARAGRRRVCRSPGRTGHRSSRPGRHRQRRE